MTTKRVIVWFRQDLRLHDNEALNHALVRSEQIIPIFVFDDRFFNSSTRFGFHKTGLHRCKFTIEAVQALRDSLRKKGSDLVVRVGKTEDVIFKIARQAKTSWVFCNRERTQEEVEIQDSLEQKLWSVGQEIIYSRGKMLYYTQDLPFPVTHTPETFTAYRREVEKFIPIREPFPVPESIPSISSRIDPGRIPDLEDFGFTDHEKDSRNQNDFEGGEEKGLERLNHFLWESEAIKTYKETRNNLLGINYSSKLSPWLSLGCISPKKVYSELKRYEQQMGANKSTYWLYFELLWRDYFRLLAKKHGSSIFLKGGVKGKEDADLQNDYRLLTLWKDGKTGVPFIDANMRELKATGFMSNRGRQNVASFLINDLKVNWQMGAEWFESMLLDYDPASNYGNWNYLAGVGADPRPDRYYNILSQARKYDPHGEYVRHWIPELAHIPGSKVHRPDILTQEEQKDFHIKVGKEYPNSMIKTSKWIGSY
ncbi:MAG: DASH family cryptochrome [Saprospiraceae bacterium]|nr:DASH family cryptochrome [Saprospiraceae bacterium]